MVGTLWPCGLLVEPCVELSGFGLWLGLLYPVLGQDTVTLTVRLSEVYKGVPEDAREVPYDGLASHSKGRPIQGESLVANRDKLKRYGTLGTWPATDFILVPFAAEIKVVTQRVYLTYKGRHATPLST